MHVVIRRILCLVLPVILTASVGAQKPRKPRPKKKDAAAKTVDREFDRYALFAKTAPRPEAAEPVETKLPLVLEPGDRVAFIGNTLFDRARDFGFFETMLHAAFPGRELVVRNLAWSADTPDLQPRPMNFADQEQHLRFVRADVIFAAYGFNESFAGPEGLAAFKQALATHVAALKTKAFNGKSGPRIVLLSPIANENVAAVPAADRNNSNIALYAEAIREVAEEKRVGFADVFTETLAAGKDEAADITINGAHLNDTGYRVFAAALFRETFDETAPSPPEALRELVLDKSRQFFHRYRPLNTYYYTGARNRSYGYLDFQPAMRNFDIMVANRDAAIHSVAQGGAPAIDDSNVPELPETPHSRGANKWMSPADELAAFKVDPRFEVNLFASEEEFPELAAPIQMRWDGRGRLWVSCSTTYPHLYPGNEPDDKIIILEDTDKDGRADTCRTFADNLEVPLSFVLDHDGLYVSEEPHLTFLQDEDGDDRADKRTVVLTGFGCEDSHHALHDFVWTPDGDLMLRESIFHHSQVETPHGPVRQQNSGWFRFQPRTQRLVAFGSYRSTNPWGVTFDDWGQHVASHPIFASAHHAVDPPYPIQHPRPGGLQAYSGTAGQEFIDFPTFPKELRGHFVKNRYKPTNRVELHEWKETAFGMAEKYVGDLIFSSNLSFIPVDIRFGPRGALYICDWYNPVKGHAQYSLRDKRRDRGSGRIWRVTAKGHELQEPPAIAGAPIADLLANLKRPEYRYRHWTKRELRGRDPEAVDAAIDGFLAGLDPADPRHRHHQLEALWATRNIQRRRPDLLRELIVCGNHHARAAATRQLRYWHRDMDDAVELLRRAANDANALVRMEAVNAATYIGSKEALDAMLTALKHPRGGHLYYAIRCALGSAPLKRHWEGNPEYQVEQLLAASTKESALREPPPSASQAQFDTRPGLARIQISCVPERLKYTVERFSVRAGQPVKLVFSNPDATDHNLIVVKPGAADEVGLAGNEMAKDPESAKGDFVPPDKAHLILHHTKMIGPNRKQQVDVLRFEAPAKPGDYPYVCTFPGHYIVMRGVMRVLPARK